MLPTQVGDEYLAGRDQTLQLARAKEWRLNGNDLAPGHGDIICQRNNRMRIYYYIGQMASFLFFGNVKADRCTVVFLSLLLPLDVNLVHI